MKYHEIIKTGSAMKLAELFDRSKTSEVDDSPTLFKSETQIGSRTIEFEAKPNKNGVWDISFYEREGKHRRTDMTGSGNEFDVMGWVFGCLKKFIAARDPNEFEIACSFNEKGRLKLYSRMLEKYLPSTYALTLRDERLYGLVVFVAKKKDLEEGQLNELVGVKKFASMSHLEIMDYITDQMYKSKVKVLGQGANALAIQIGDLAYKFWFKDSAYEDFVKYALANQSNPFMPKLFSGIKEMPAFFMRHPKAPDTVKYVKMEILKFKPGIQIKCTNTGIPLSASEIVYMIKTHEASMRTLEKAEKKFLTYFKLKAIGEEDDEPNQESLHLTDEFKMFIKTIFDLKEISDHFLDSNPANYVARGDQVVILDPLANEKDLSLNHYLYDFADKYARDKDLESKTPARRSNSRAANNQGDDKK